ncbi:MAG: DEAD/DEAH box helicase [Desulfobacterales bacterium]|nr:DEAD/DEAH box helicase [Desulfobacterales bacterium]
MKADINEYIRSLIASDVFRSQVVYHRVLPAKPAGWSAPKSLRLDAVKAAFLFSGIKKLYTHQAQAVDWIRSGRHVMVATPTASGKTLIYNLPVLEKVCTDSNSKALYIFPLKALAQDQLRALERLANGGSPQINLSAAIYDGDTSAWHRRRIRQSPPHVLLTNPEMLHLSLLPYYRKWSEFYKNLNMVVVDEVHTYRGLMGAHMAQVFRRFLRICAFYGRAPTFVFSSATVANPCQLAEQLTGLKVQTITHSGAPQGRRHVVFIDPIDGPVQAAIRLLTAALHRGLRTIVYTQSRKLAELISIWASTRSGRFAGRISAYRAGFLPEERREIEDKLSKGELIAVISTSALELGIDIGDLDLCLLVGYPGTIVSTWQRGGRVGRSGQDSAFVLIAGDDALDQYFMRNPEEFIHRDPEAAIINPYNPEIMAKHLICAAAEMPLKADEPLLSSPAVQKIVQRLESQGELLRSADGKEIYSRQRSPHRFVDLRGSGSRFNIVCSQTGNNRGEIDGFRAFKETHPGAIYLHRGDSYLVDHLDTATRTVKVSQAKVDYYTKVRSYKNTEILEIFDEKPVWGTTVFCGRLKVTEHVTGYEKWQLHAKRMLNIISLDLPPLIFETEGLWFQIPIEVQRQAESKHYHFMGGIHAIEHAAIGIFPLLIMTDRNDLGGISTPYHFQISSAAIFVYDGVPGGAGLSLQAFKQAEQLLAYTLKLIMECPCESGCPSCVHSPKCGSGNRPIDKAAACFVLETIKDGQKILDRPSAGVKRIRPAGQVEQFIDSTKGDTLNSEIKNLPQNFRFGVLDIETQRSAAEVGGWHRADLMGVSCAVVYDSAEDTFYEFLEPQINQMIEHLKQFDLVVGFNILRFDYSVLRGYAPLFDFNTLPTLDILDQIYKRLGYRLSLDHLAQVTLGAEKSADGLQALQWWKEGRIREIIDYCKMDVEITRDLFLYGKKNNYLLFNNKSGNSVRLPVNW